MEKEKPCINCKKMLPAGASFCPWCETDLTVRKEAPLTVRHTPRLLPLLLLFAAAACIACFLFFRKVPKTYEGGSSVEWPLRGNTYTVYLSFRPDAGKTGLSMSEAADKLRSGLTSHLYPMLFVQDGAGMPAGASFFEEVKSCAVRTVPHQGSRAMQVSDPSFGYPPFVKTADSSESNAEAPESEASDLAAAEPVISDAPPVYYADLLYAAGTGTNDILWELTMKNGDTIRVSQTVSCGLVPVLEYHHETTPLTTVGEILAVLEDASGKADEETIVELWLPPVVYEGQLDLGPYPAVLHGSRDGDRQTTFSDTVTVSTRSSNITELYDIAFAGNAGSGLYAHECVYARNCSFTGWDVGADTANGGWIMLEHCSFEHNRIGFRFNSETATATNQDYTELTFRDNGTAVKLENVPKDVPLFFRACIFDGNGTDIEDPKGLAELAD